MGGESGQLALLSACGDWTARGNRRGRSLPAVEGSEVRRQWYVEGVKYVGSEARCEVWTEVRGDVGSEVGTEVGSEVSMK